MLSQGAISTGTNGLARSISFAANNLRANRAAPIEAKDQPQKNFVG
jgi:hypothetical protein